MKVRVSAIQMLSTDNLEENLKVAAQLINQAVNQGAQLVVLPEMFAFFGGNDQQWLSLLTQENEERLKSLISEWACRYDCWIVTGTLPFITRKDGTRIHDGRCKAVCGLVNAQGQWVACYEKYHLFCAAIEDDKKNYDESKRFEPGGEWVVAESPWGPLGLAVCFDLRFSEQFLFYRKQGVKWVVLPSAFTEKTGQAHWEILLRARAIEHQTVMIAANQGGDHGGGRKTWGQSMIVDAWGRVLSQTEKGAAVVSAQIDFDEVDKVRASIPMRR